jgi:nuclear GTP-binding protein
MYRGKVKHDEKTGKLVQGSVLSAAEREQLDSGKSMRIAPNRKWFGNTRVVTSAQLEELRDELAQHARTHDPYTVLLHRKTLPRSILFADGSTVSAMQAAKNLKKGFLQVEPFDQAFSKHGSRKRPKLSSTFSDISQLATAVQEAAPQDEISRGMAEYEAGRTSILDGAADEARDAVFSKGQSRRIWGELYKVIDASDVLIQVLDARDPVGTRCTHLEQYLRREKAHKHMILLLNKCDLVPTWATARWVRHLSQEYPTIAFHASLTKPFGKGALIHALRQFKRLHPEKQSISIGFVGFPNVGKSSVINALRSKRVCPVAPIPGETKVWQYITLFKNVFLIDCPGVVYEPSSAGGSSFSETDLVLRGVVRIERIPSPEDHVHAVLDRIKKDHLTRTYGVREWKDAYDFLEKMCSATGKLLKGGEADMSTAAKKILQDWQRGRLPWFVAPPFGGDQTKVESKSIGVVQHMDAIQVANEFAEDDDRPADFADKEYVVGEGEDADAAGLEEVFSDEEFDESAAKGKDRRTSATSSKKERVSADRNPIDHPSVDGGLFSAEADAGSVAKSAPEADSSVVRLAVPKAVVMLLRKKSWRKRV